MKTNASIVTYRTDSDELRKCLRSLSASGDIATVYIVDNSSSAATEAVAAEFEGVEYIPHPNTGYGDAHNVALRKSLDAGADFHLVINSDVYFGGDVLPRCLGYMAEHQECVQLIPHTVFPDGRRQYVCHPLPTPFDMLMRGFLPKSWFRGRRRRYDLADFALDRPLDVPYHHGCFMLLRCSALRECGLFDPRYFMYPEDIDLTRRMHRHGETVYFPGATIVHAHRAESKKSWRMRKVHIVNMLRYFRKWGFFIDAERRRENRRLYDSMR